MPKYIVLSFNHDGYNNGFSYLLVIRTSALIYRWRSALFPEELITEDDVRCPSAFPAPLIIREESVYVVKTTSLPLLPLHV